ncbi:MAG: hypothetical protein H7235_01365 [Bdellovibrionaceae bacterium]|nr:hypothetical protein [Pseudobdellovibrionaceae bacterium]
MQKIILILSFLFSWAQAQVPAKPVALFLDCNIGTNYSNAIAATMKKRGEELIVIKCKDFEAKMAELSQKNVYVKTLFASGHDGDGKVHGDQYGEDKGEFEPVDDIAEINAKYPKLFAQTQTYYPLGCYTTTPSNLQQYVYVMPNLKFVAGYFGAAHSANRKVAQDYLNEVLTEEDSIINAGSAAEFEKLTSSLATMNTDINMGMYRNFACKSKSSDYTGQNLSGWARTVDHDDSKINRVVNFSKEECLALKPEFDKNWLEYIEYVKGNREIAKDTKSGPLRALYSFFRQNDYCKFVIKDGSFKHYPFGDNVFTLLFHRQIRENFSIWAGSDLNDLQKKLSNELRQNKSPEVQQILQQAIAQVKAINEEDMKLWPMKKVYQASLTLAAADDRLTRLLADKKIVLQDEKIKQSLNKMSKNFTRLVIDRNAPLSWHELDPNYLPEDPE